MKGIQLAVTLLLHAIAAHGSDITTKGTYDFVVSVPDVHGDLEALLRAMWMVRVEAVNEADLKYEYFRQIFVSAIKEEKFTPISSPKDPRILLIQTGDIIDRGEASLSCYKAIWKVKAVLGWDVVNLVGNHEVMTIAGRADHYAHADDVREFGSKKARREAFSPGGSIWRRITEEFQFLARVNMGETESVLFVHAGLDSGWLKNLKLTNPLTVQSINELLMRELKLNPNSNLLTSSTSPIWTRDLANKHEKTVCDKMLPKIFDSLGGITRMVVGHTPQEQLVADAKCEAKLILADVAMSRWMGSGKFGNPSAVIFSLENDGSQLSRIHAVYWRGATEKVFEQLIFQAPKDEIMSGEL